MYTSAQTGFFFPTKVQLGRARATNILGHKVAIHKPSNKTFVETADTGHYENACPEVSSQ